MKKSMIYKLSQVAVINSAGLSSLSKLEILNVLMADENLARFTEEQEEKANA